MSHERSSAKFSSPLLLRHELTLPGDPHPISHAARTFTTKLLFTSFAQAQTDIASPHLKQHHMPDEHSPINFSSPLLLTHAQTIPRDHQPTSHAGRTFTKKLLSTPFAHAQTNFASRTFTNITRLTNLPHHTSLHLFRSGANKPCLAHINRYHMAHEHSPRNFSSPMMLTHKRTLPREPQPASHATRIFLITILFISSAQAQTNIASGTSTNITCHKNIRQQTSVPLFCSAANAHSLANLNQHYIPHKHP